MFKAADMDSKSIDKPLAAPVWLPDACSLENTLQWIDNASRGAGKQR